METLRKEKQIWYIQIEMYIDSQISFILDKKWMRRIMKKIIEIQSKCEFKIEIKKG